MDCPYDSHVLMEEGNDCRQEWREIHYSCSVCEATFTRRTNYKVQSHLIESDTLIDDETGEKF